MEPDPPTRPSPLRRILIGVVKLVLTLVVTVFIVRRVGVDVDTLSRMDPGRWRFHLLPLLGSAVVLGAGYAVSASLWGRMLREMGGPPLPARRSVPLFMVANLGRYVPGKVVQIAGLAWLARGEGVRPVRAAGAAVVGQGVSLLGATIMGLAAFFSPALDPAYRAWGWAGLLLATVFVVLTSVPATARRLEAVLFRLARTDPPSEGEDPVLRRGFGLRWTAAYLGNWALYATAFWLLYLGLEGWAPFLYVGPAFAAAYVGGYLALFAPAGLGIREGLLVAFLAPVLEPGPALALAAAARLWTTGVEVVPAALMAPSVLRRRPESLEEEG